MNEKDAALLLGVSVRTLQGWRLHHRGPRYIVLAAKAVRYRRGDLIAWTQRCTMETTDDHAAVAGVGE